MTITLRTEKGFPLTYEELDGNFTDLDTRISQIEGIAVNTVNGQTGDVVLTTSNIAEGTNLYYTEARFDAKFLSKTTTSLAEGSNLYFTAARVRGNISVTSGLTYDSGTGVISLSANTDVISEGVSNQYFTNGRADARIAAATLDDINDVDYATSPVNGDVLTWNSSSGKWEPIVPPGAAGGETNTASNLGAGSGLFAAKVGPDLRFYSITGASGISITGPISNSYVISPTQDISTSGTPAFASVTAGNVLISNDTVTTNTSNGNIKIVGDGTGYVVVDAGGGLSMSGTTLYAPAIATFSNANISLTPNGTGQVVASNLAVSTLTSSRIVFAGTNGTLTDDADMTFAGNVLTVAGNVNATVIRGGNITTTVDTISSVATNGNINITSTGTGLVKINSLAVNNLTSTRIPYATANGQLIDNTNLTFSGSTINLIGTANVTVLNAGNVSASGNQIISTNANGNINIAPNGTGRIGVNTTSPAYLMSVNGSFGSTTINTTGNVTVGNSLVIGTSASVDTIDLTARFASNLVPNSSGTYDLGTNTLKFRNAWLNGTLTVDGSTVLGDGAADTVFFNALIGSTITPAASGTLDLGTNATRWRDLYLTGTATVNTLAASTLSATTITANVVGGLSRTVTGTNSFELVRGNMADNDQFRILVGGTASDAGYAEIATSDNGTEPIYVRQYSGTFSSLVRTATLLDGSGNTSIPGSFLPIANATQNIGTTGLRWNQIWGVSSSALYADLAERYEADAIYDEGTVVVFGGGKEITACTLEADTAVAGVVSTNPAYIMNDGGQDPAYNPAIALRGKVPIKVIGKVAKGDLLITSRVHGHAISVGKEDYGCSVIAKAIQDKHTEEAGIVLAVVI